MKLTILTFNKPGQPHLSLLHHTRILQIIIFYLNAKKSHVSDTHAHNPYENHYELDYWGIYIATDKRGII